MDFSSMADDFFVNLNIETTVALPQARETVLHFFEAMQKQFPTMTGFYQRDGREFVLEGDREAGQYRWAELHANRLCAGYFNPPSIDEAITLHSWVIERSLYYLGLGGLDVDAMDLLYGFNLDYSGNRDALVASALLGESPLGRFAHQAGQTPLEFEPHLVVSLDEHCYAQGRIAIETRCNSYQVRTGQYDEEPISIYFTARQYPAPASVMNLPAILQTQRELCDDVTARVLLPEILQPISEAIATGQ
jgi:hypothetical protein